MWNEISKIQINSDTSIHVLRVGRENFRLAIVQDGVEVVFRYNNRTEALDALLALERSLS